MMKVNRNKCIACQLCIKDCPTQCISLVEGKAEIDNTRCIKCGHCIAICPTYAISSDEYDMNEVLPYDEENFKIDPDILLNFIKYRRSMRRYLDKDVEDEKIEKIIEAGRFTQTSTNNQDVSYVVIKGEKIKELREIVLDSLHDIGQFMLKNLTEATKRYERYARAWIKMYEDNKSDSPSPDRIFFDAPVLILVITPTPINGGLASSNMELMINALGLGTFFSGFTVRAAQDSTKLRDFIGLKENQQLITCMAIGYPKSIYKRTVPRKKADITWL